MVGRTLIQKSQGGAVAATTVRGWVAGNIEGQRWGNADCQYLRLEGVVGNGLDPGTRWNLRQPIASEQAGADRRGTRRPALGRRLRRGRGGWSDGDRSRRALARSRRDLDDQYIQLAWPVDQDLGRQQSRRSTTASSSSSDGDGAAAGQGAALAHRWRRRDFGWAPDTGPAIQVRRSEIPATWRGCRGSTMAELHRCRSRWSGCSPGPVGGWQAVFWKSWGRNPWCWAHSRTGGDHPPEPTEKNLRTFSAIVPPKARSASPRSDVIAWRS